jgi:ABC-type glucose/galactose transport system permease subunit
MKSLKKSQIKLLTGFLGDIAKGLMLGVVVGQWSIANIEIYSRVAITIIWFAWSLLCLHLAVFLAKYE